MGTSGSQASFCRVLVGASPQGLRRSLTWVQVFVRAGGVLGSAWPLAWPMTGESNGHKGKGSGHQEVQGCSLGSLGRNLQARGLCRTCWVPVWGWKAAATAPQVWERGFNNCARCGQWDPRMPRPADGLLPPLLVAPCLCATRLDGLSPCFPRE